MDSIKGWAALIAATAIVGAVFTALLPPGKTKAAFMTLVGVVVVCAAISPFASKSGVDFEFSEYIFNADDYEEKFKAQSSNAAKRIAQSGFEDAIKQRLEKMNVSAKLVSVVCGDDCSVQSVTVVSDCEDKEKVESAVKEVCGSIGQLEILSIGEANEK